MNEENKISVGDRVIIEGSGDRYAITRDGSEGVVTDLQGEIVAVQFDKLTGDNARGHQGSVISVSREYAKVIQPAQQRQENGLLTIAFGERSLSFNKELVAHQTLDELFDRFCKAYGLSRPLGYKAESNLQIVHSGAAEVVNMPAGTSELRITEEDVAMPYRPKTSPYRPKTSGYDQVTEDDGERVYKDAKTDAIIKAGITKEELDAVVDAMDTIKDALEEYKELIASFIAKGNAL